LATDAMTRHVPQAPSPLTPHGGCVMSRRSIEGGTLALPWPSSSQRSRRRIETDAGVLAATVVLALVGLVMVFSASAVLAGNRFHDSIYFLKRQVVWLAFGFLLLHLASRVDYTLWRR